MREGGAVRDAEEPRAERHATIELAEATMDDQEDFLSRIVEPSFVNAESAQTAPHEGEVIAVDPFEVLHGNDHTVGGRRTPQLGSGRVAQHGRADG